MHWLFSCFVCFNETIIQYILFSFSEIYNPLSFQKFYFLPLTLFSFFKFLKGNLDKASPNAGYVLLMFYHLYEGKVWCFFYCNSIFYVLLFSKLILPILFRAVKSLRVNWLSVLGHSSRCHCWNLIGTFMLTPVSVLSSQLMVNFLFYHLMF